MADMITLMNTILANASSEYTSRVPEATQDNISNVANAILTYSPTTNEFLSTLINRIGLTMVRNLLIKNPLAVLKKGGMPLGDTIQEIFTNPATAASFGDGSDLLTKVKPDTYSLYHKRNRQDVYTVTITPAELSAAFTSYGKLNEFLNSKVNSLYSGDSLDEYVLMKNLFADAVTNNKIPVFDLTTGIEADGGPAELVKALRKTSLLMKQPGGNFNKFKDIQGALVPPVVTSDIITWTPLENQVILIRADVLAEIDIEVLAKAFNIGKTDFLAKLIEVDSFGSATDVYTIVCDESITQVYDNKFETAEFYNPKGLYWNYFLHHWQTLSLSYFANAAAYKYTAPPAG